MSRTLSLFWVECSDRVVSEKSTQMRDDRERDRRETEKEKVKIDRLIGKYHNARYHTTIVL